MLASTAAAAVLLPMLWGPAAVAAAPWRAAGSRQSSLYGISCFAEVMPAGDSVNAAWAKFCKRVHVAAAAQNCRIRLRSSCCQSQPQQLVRLLNGSSSICNAAMTGARDTPMHCAAMFEHAADICTAACRPASPPVTTPARASSSTPERRIS
jgi:hypothetical protein